MSFVDELATLSDQVVRGLGADTSVDIVRRTRGTFDPATQVHGADTVDTHTCARYIRSASRQVTVPGGNGFIRVEEFSVTVTVADLVADGWAGHITAPLDERTEVKFGSVVYPVVGVDRECGEGLVKLLVRTDTGQQV